MSTVATKALHPDEPEANDKYWMKLYVGLILFLVMQIGIYYILTLAFA